jgi:hypothetical protein
MPHVNTPQSTCRLGLARCDITPPVGIYHRMWGAATHDRATGVHRPLTATALAFRPADETGLQDEHVILTLDHCLLWPKEMNALLAAVRDGTDLTAEQVLVTFSHTHGAGLMGLERGTLPGGALIAPYLEELGRKVAALVREARRAVRPVTVQYGTGRCPLAAHRDFWDEASGQFVCGYNPAGPADDTVLAARACESVGGVVATFVNYACHPTTLAWENTLISPDYPGAMRELVEQATGAPCVFLQGASGDLGPREGYVGDPAVADRNGRQLGHAALAALEALPPPGTRFAYQGPVISGATLGPWSHVPLDGPARRGLARWRRHAWTLDLPYRPELRGREATEAERRKWQEQEAAAHAAGDPARARDCRAMVERMDRWLTRLAALPPGPAFPFRIALWQTGTAFWVAVGGEHYQFLQRTLRDRFPGVPIVVVTLANGWGPSYLPTADVYGKGIYQESIAVLAPGCLERLTEAIGNEIAAWLAGS